MYEIIYYRNEKGEIPIREYIDALLIKGDKDSHINANKIIHYIDALAENGNVLGEPIMKQIDEEIWELRPIINRIFFAAWDGNKYILLHHFRKKSRKTPRREIERAKRYLADWKERNKKNGA
jgi:phage-related protein